MSLIHDTGILVGLLSVSAFLAQPRAASSARSDDGAPPQFSAVACYQMVQDAGRPIAWARWEKGLPLEKARSAKFRDGTPGWAANLVQEWIADAYQWRASDEQVRQWATELGSVDDLPSAEALSVHETIAIWMRRIARRCGEREVHASAPANLTSDEVRSRAIDRPALRLARVAGTWRIDRICCSSCGTGDRLNGNLGWHRGATAVHPRSRIQGA